MKVLSSPSKMVVFLNTIIPVPADTVFVAVDGDGSVFAYHGFDENHRTSFQAEFFKGEWGVNEWRMVLPGYRDFNYGVTKVADIEIMPDSPENLILDLRQIEAAYTPYNMHHWVNFMGQAVEVKKDCRFLALDKENRLIGFRNRPVFHNGGWMPQDGMTFYGRFSKMFLQHENLEDTLVQLLSPAA